MAHEHAHLPDDQRAAAGGTGTDPLATIDDEDIEIVEGMGEEVPVPDAVAAWFREQPIGFGQVTGTGDNLLHLAAADGRVDVLEWLLDAGVDPRTVDYAGEDALTLAIRHAHYAAANLLIKYAEEVEEAVEVATVSVPMDVPGADGATGAAVGAAATDSRLPDVSPAPAPSPAVPATPVGSSADETVDVPPPPPSDTRATKGTGITKRGITRDMYRREGTARHTGTYRRGQESTNVAILDTEPSEPASDSNRAGTGPSAAVPYPADPARRIGRRLRPFHLALIGFFLVLIGMVGNVIGEMTIPASFVSSRYPAGTVYDITPERDFLPDAEVETYRHMMKITAYTPSSVEVEYYFEGPDSPVVTGDGEKTSLSFSDLLDRRLRTAHQRERYGTGYFPSLLAPAYTAAALAVDGAVVSFVPDVRATPGVRWLIDNIVLGLAAVLAFAVLLAIPTAFDRASAGRTACGAVTRGIALGCLPLVAAVAFGGESAGAMARHFPAAMSVAPGLAVGAFLALVLLALIWPLTGLVALASHLAGGRAGNALRYVVSIVVALLIVSLAVNSATLTIALAVAVLVVAALTGQEPEAAAAVNQPARPSSDGNRE